MERLDSKHSSQRWLRCTQVGTDAVVMSDLYQPLDIQGCGCGRCEDLTGEAATREPRFRVTRFWGMKNCPFCFRPYGYGRADENALHGDSMEDTLRRIRRRRCPSLASQSLRSRGSTQIGSKMPSTHSAPLLRRLI